MGATCEFKPGKFMEKDCESQGFCKGHPDRASEPVQPVAKTSDNTTWHTPMSEDEIDAEIQAHRREKRANPVPQEVEENPTPPNSSKEFEAELKNLTTVVGLDNGGDGEPDLWQFDDWRGVIAAHHKASQELVRQAEARGAAFAVKVLDELHIGSDGSITTDRLYKGLKNTIRDRFKAETGIDPAPSYPINAELSKLEGGEK